MGNNYSAGLHKNTSVLKITMAFVFALRKHYLRVGWVQILFNQKLPGRGFGKVGCVLWPKVTYAVANRGPPSRNCNYRLPMHCTEKYNCTYFVHEMLSFETEPTTPVTLYIQPNKKVYNLYVTIHNVSGIAHIYIRAIVCTTQHNAKKA